MDLLRNVVMTEFQNLRSIKQLVEINPAFSEGSLRWLIFNAKQNDFDSVLVRVGHRVLVDLELPGRADDVEQLKQSYEDALENTQIEVVPTGKSASFRRRVPRVEPPDFVEEPMRSALKAASELLAWRRKAQSN